MREETMKKEGPLYDAARMLRVAARLLEKIADTDDTVRVNDDFHAIAEAQRKRVTEAQANIDAAVARMHPYR
jgi:hypothetical protein